MEDRLVFLGDGKVRLGDELDLEGAVGLGFGRAVGDLLRARIGGRTPEETPVPPVGIADLADDVIADLGPAHRRPGIGHGLAFKLDLAAQPGGGLRRVERDLELGPLVFLDAHPSVALQAVSMDHHPAHEPVPRGREVAAEGTVVVRRQRLPGDLLAVDVAEDDGHLLVRQDLVVVAFLIDQDGDALVVDRLAGAIQRAVGEEDHLFLRNRPVVVGISIQVVGRGELLARVGDVEQVILPGQALYRELAVAVGPHFGAGGDAAVPIPGVALHVGPFDRLARGGIEHEAAETSVVGLLPDDQGQLAHPDVRIGNDVVRRAETRIVTGQQVIEAGLQVLRGGKVLDPLLKILGRRQIGRPGQIGLRGQKGLPPGVVQPLGPRKLPLFILAAQSSRTSRK